MAIPYASNPYPHQVPAKLVMRLARLDANEVSSIPLQKFGCCFTPPEILDGQHRQSLAFSERDQLSQAILQFHVERMLNE